MIFFSMSDIPEHKHFFQQQLFYWFEQSHRPLPWKGLKDPYLIWLSEIILQQTRVEQGRAYFERFRQRFPRVEDLAAAPEDEVLKLWEGLGYYSRARNLHRSAKMVVQEFDGVFPSDYESILSLKGIGPYTAAAIASFAYGLPHAVVDGNVFRVLARFFDIDTPIDSTKGKKQFQKLAQELLDASQPGRYNQAIMDFGATHCKPAAPKCDACPLQTNCMGFQKNKVEQLPVKAKKLKKRIRFFNYLVLQEGERCWIEKRTAKDIWQGLYQFPLIESEAQLESADQLVETDLWHQWVVTGAVREIKAAGAFRQTLSHQYIYARFWEVQLSEGLQPNKTEQFLTDRKNLSKFAFPKIIDWYLGDNSLYLNLST
jgi:A/G-specific adenine glycosylase